MKIVTWSSQDAPPSQTWIARFLVKEGFLPVIVSAPTEAEVREKAQAFWETERARLQKGGKPRGQADPVAHLTAAERAHGEDAAATMLIPQETTADPMDALFG